MSSFQFGRQACACVCFDGALSGGTKAGTSQNNSGFPDRLCFKQL
jgi:hypothetical protein